MLIRLLIIGAVIAVVVWVIVSMRKGSRLKCAQCRHCRKLFEDGSMCGFGTKEVYKTIVHIENCGDFQRR